MGRGRIGKMGQASAWLGVGDDSIAGPPLQSGIGRHHATLQ